MISPSRIIAAVLLAGAFTIHNTAAEMATGTGSCFHQGYRQISGAISFSKPGVYTAFDLGILDLISVGGAAGYNRFTDYRGWKYSRYPVLGRIALHPLNFSFLADLLLIRDHIDLYGGMAAGFTYIHSTWYGVGSTPIGKPDESGVSISEYLGLRYSINDRWQLFVEDCRVASNFAIGVGYQL